MSLKIICFNAPPRSGKTTAANILEKLYNSAQRHCSVYPLAEPIYQIIGTVLFRGFNIDVKNTPISELGNMTLRESAIEIGQTFKEKFGADVWVNRVIARVSYAYESENLKHMGLSYDTFIIPDLGFQNELSALVRAFGQESITLVKLAREGCTYEGDSRGDVKNELYLEDFSYKVDCYKVDNNGDINDLTMRLQEIFINRGTQYAIY